MASRKKRAPQTRNPKGEYWVLTDSEIGCGAFQGTESAAIETAKARVLDDDETVYVVRVIGTAEKELPAIAFTRKK
jgi:hypothetical protein